MSHETSPKDSESSNSSPNAVYMLRSDKDFANELILFGATATKHNRSATVRRASSASFRNKQDSFAKSQDDMNIPVNMPTDRYRRSLDSTYRQSLESISEYKTKISFSSTSLTGPPTYRESLDSTHSDCTDYATRSATDTKADDQRTDKTFASPSSAGYLSWIESVHSEYFANANCNNSSNTHTTADIVDIDNKVGEWNNFWLNYNNPNNRYLSSPYLCASNDDRTGDDISDCKSTCSTQREFNDKVANEQILLTLDEVQEALQCSQRIVEILQKALKRTDNDLLFIERSRQDSYYSQQTYVANSFNDESFRERSFSYVMDQDLQKQKTLLKPTQPAQPQTAANSCINALLNNGVADILKRVMQKRREVLTPTEHPSTPRSSFSDWSTGAK